jgi:NDP-sugar pyrophosphorylase family protein
MVRTAVIIAGGEGSRLKPLSTNKPKAMVEVSGQPMLHWVLRWLQFHGIKRVVIGVAYKKERIFDFLRNHKPPGLDVECSVHTVAGGTAQGFRLAISRYVEDDDFVAMNCDEITNMDLRALVRVHQSKRPIATMALAPFHCRFSVVVEGADQFITGFRYGHILQDVPVSIGIYVFNREILPLIPETGSIENEVFAKLAPQSKIAFHRLAADEQWISVNDLKNVREVEANPEVLTLSRVTGTSVVPAYGPSLPLQQHETR